MKRGKLRKNSKNPVSKLRKKAIITFNNWIRKRDEKRLEGLCYTCGKRATEAGHYGYGMLRFDERAVNFQCSRCNKWLHGNLGAYAARLIADYGWKTFDEMERLKRTPLKLNAKYLKEIIKKYEKT